MPYTIRVQGQRTLTIYRQGADRLYVADVATDKTLYNGVSYTDEELKEVTGEDRLSMVTKMVENRQQKGRLNAPRNPIVYQPTEGRTYTWLADGSIERVLSGDDSRPYRLKSAPAGLIAAIIVHGTESGTAT